MIGSTSRLLHVSRPESMLDLIHLAAQAIILRMIKVNVDLEGSIRATCARRWMRLRTADSGYGGMMHYRMGSDSVPSRIDAIRGLLADDPDLAEVLGGREMRRNSRTVSISTSQVKAIGI